MNNNKYYRYQLTYPFEGSKIYKSKKLSKIVKKCYNEYKKNNDIGEGLFCITNIDKGVEYHFGVKNKKIKKHKSQFGGESKNLEENDVRKDLEFLGEDKNNVNDPNMDTLMSDINYIKENIDIIKNKLSEQPNDIEPKKEQLNLQDSSEPLEENTINEPSEITHADNNEPSKIMHADNNEPKKSTILDTEERQAIKKKYTDLLDNHQQNKPFLPKITEPEPITEKKVVLLPREEESFLLRSKLDKERNIREKAKNFYDTMNWTYQPKKTDDSEDMCIIM
jgi:hypothetical protein